MTLPQVDFDGTSRARGFLSHEQFAALGASVPAGLLSSARPKVEADDTAAIIYTSGTTAAPKGCELSHRGLQLSWSAFGNVVELRAGDSVCVPMPFYHTGGIGPMTAALYRGATIVSMPHHEPDVVVALIDRCKINRHSMHS